MLPSNTVHSLQNGCRTRAVVRHSVVYSIEIMASNIFVVTKL